MKITHTAIFLSLALLTPGRLEAVTPLSITWANLDNPLGATYPSGISGNKVVGLYNGHVGSSPVDLGFLYDGTNFITIDDPSALTRGSSRTQANGIDGNNIVGWYSDLTGSGAHGFLYDGASWTTLNYPQANSITHANGISGNKVVGYYREVNEDFAHGFEYDTIAHSYSTLINPSFPSLGLSATAIYGNKVVGVYNGVSLPPGGASFLFNGTTWTGISDPDATNGETIAQGIDGNNIVGYFQNASGHHGFLYDGTSWTTLDNPLAKHDPVFGTFVTGISGNNLVGWYLDNSNMIHGFTATIVPEPPTLKLAVAAIALFMAASLLRRGNVGPGRTKGAN